ncbi:MAG: BatA domain-containing protein, partial [Bacteroidales bacterium]
MQFLNPMVLYGLIALAIPVLIHLFNFKRPKRVFFTNVRFLRELKLESRRRSQIKHLIIMLMRLFAFASLIFAFAMPVIRKGDQPPLHGKPLIVIYLDNSNSLQVLGSDGMLFEQAVRKVTEIAGYYQPSDEFYLITNDFSPRYTRVVNRSDLTELVTTVKFSPVSRSAAEIFEKVEDLRSRSQGRDLVLYFVSDFQLSVVDIAGAAPVESIETYLVPLSAGSHTGNLYLDSVWMDIPVIRPGQIVEFQVRIGNTGLKAVEEIPVALTLNGREAAVGTVTIPASSKATMKLTTRIASEGIYHGVVTIDDFPVVFDDRFYIGTKVSQERRVLVLQGGKDESAIARLFEGDSLFRYESRPATQIDFSSLNRYDIVFCSGLQEISSGLTQALTSFVDDGGALVVIPPSLPGNARGINPLLSSLGVSTYGLPDTADARVAFINFDHPLYKGVYSEKPAKLAMPLIFGHHAIQPAGAAGEAVIMRMLNERPLLMSSPSGKGMVYLFATALDPVSSTLAGHAEIFVPPVYNMALYSGVVPPLYYVTGIDKS